MVLLDDVMARVLLSYVLHVSMHSSVPVTQALNYRVKSNPTADVSEVHYGYMVDGGH